MKCKLTGNEGDGIKAHIIPRSFYNIDPEENRPSKILTNAIGEYERRTPIGIYDKEIVTVEGERLFSPWDDYASEILISRRDEQIPMDRRGETIGYELAEFNFELLKLFFLSVIWRAHHTKHPFFAGVRLGPFENKIRQILLSSSVSDTDGFDITLARWNGNPDSAGILNPHSTRFDGIKFYLIYLYQYIAYIKMDSQNSNHLFSRMRIRPGQSLKIIGRDLEDSKERELMIRLVND